MRKLHREWDWAKLWRTMIWMAMDVIMLNTAVWVAYLIRCEFRIDMILEADIIGSYMKITPWYTLLSLVVFAAFRLYRSLWEFASVEELWNVAVSAVISSCSYRIIGNTMGIAQPRSIVVLHAVFLMLALGAIRYSYRLVWDFKARPIAEQKRTMLIGAGATGAGVLKELQRSAHSRNKVVCVIDDNTNKVGSYLHSVPVVGNRDAIPEMVKKYRVTDIILAMPTAKPQDKRAIVSICQKTKCRLQTLPGVYQLASGQLTAGKIRDIRVEDLLGRDKVEVNLNEIAGYLRDKVVLVTGGGGSIGSELCRQAANQHPKQLIIFDIYENNAYAIEQELRYAHPELDLRVLIGSVRDRARVIDLFETYHPDIICHAAAHKHVPLMEESPNEAIKNNVFGTLNVAKAADRYGAERFVLISTDKAVNPTNVMGASKRICEMIIQVLGQRSKTCFTAVRFGNVLGSNGSVIPLFKKQIQHGGPVTVTHKDIIRYFMTITEAVSLVLQAGAYAKGGEVFVLDMGEPMRVDDLARNMIRLSGFEPDVDIPVVYTGLRPGEKLYEEILMQDEGLEKTPNDLIYIGHFNDFDREGLKEGLNELERACQRNSADIRDVILRLVKTYHPKPELVKNPVENESAVSEKQANLEFTDGRTCCAAAVGE